jgi:uncharacterized protein DUF6982
MLSENTLTRRRRVSSRVRSLQSGISRMAHKVVAHFQNGRLVKGSTVSLLPDRPICHIMTRDQGTLPVRLSDLKALFIVKDLEGNSAQVDQQAIATGDGRATGAKRLQIIFRDGERLLALAPTYEGTRAFFFVLPADANSNNIRILVNRAAVASVAILKTT